MKRCDYCEYMAGKALPGHWVEVRNLAGSDVWRFDVDLGAGRDSFAGFLRREFEALEGDHTLLGSYWGQLAFVRRTLRANLGVDEFRRRLEALNASQSETAPA